MDLAEANLSNNPVWYKLYSARDAYQLPSLMPHDWHNLVIELDESDELFSLFYKYGFFSYSTYWGTISLNSSSYVFLIHINLISQTLLEGFISETDLWIKVSEGPDLWSTFGTFPRSKNVVWEGEEENSQKASEKGEEKGEKKIEENINVHKGKQRWRGYIWSVE